MASSWFLKLAFKCLLDHFAWPLLALGYPLCASVRAIETDSYAETRNLISYWILLALIYLFEHAFVRLLQCFQLWPYIKLMIIFWLIIPDFGRASYVYNNLIRPCIFMEQESVICRLNNYWRKFFVEKDNILPHAERYIKDNVTEALEKLIASKNTMNKPDAESTIAITATDYKEMQQTNGKILQTEHTDSKDSKQLKNTINKPDEEATNAIKATDNKEMHPTNGERLQTEHQDIKDVEIIEKKETAAGKQDINASSGIIVGTKGIVGKDTVGGELPQSSTRKELQKEWTCALCQVTTTCEENLNSHLRGLKHRATCEALKAKNQPTLQKPKISRRSKKELKHKTVINQLNSNAKNGEQSNVNKGSKGTAAMDYKVRKPQNNLPEPVRKKFSKFKCVVCNIILQSEANAASHFNGKKHLAKIQVSSLQNNRDIA